MMQPRVTLLDPTAGDEGRQEALILRFYVRRRCNSQNPVYGTGHFANFKHSG